jgi:hypothetical protein
MFRTLLHETIHLVWVDPTPNCDMLYFGGACGMAAASLLSRSIRTKILQEISPRNSNHRPQGA